MSSPLKHIPILTHTNHTLTPLEGAFITSFLVCKSGAQAVRDAGYKTKNPQGKASDLLCKVHIVEEIKFRLAELESSKIAAATEILQFYTSVMRGEVLDQFGIEASLDTRIKSANELARHQIELPLKLEQKNITNNIGSITLNFQPRLEESVIDAEES